METETFTHDTPKEIEGMEYKIFSTTIQIVDPEPTYTMYYEFLEHGEHVFEKATQYGFREIICGVTMQERFMYVHFMYLAGFVSIKVAEFEDPVVDMKKEINIFLNGLNKEKQK